MFHLQLFVASDLPQSCPVVGGTRGAQQPVLPQGSGPVCEAEDRRTDQPQHNLCLTAPPEKSHTEHHAPTSFLRSGRFSDLRRNTNRKSVNNFITMTFLIFLVLERKTTAAHKRDIIAKDSDPLLYSNILLSSTEIKMVAINSEMFLKSIIVDGNTEN